MKRFLTVICVAINLMSCKEATEPLSIQEQPTDEITDAEYSILALLVDPSHEFPTDSVLVLQDSTSAGISEYDLESSLTNILQYVSQRVNSLRPETMQNFRLKNLTHTYIKNPTKIHPACVYKSKTDAIFPLLSVSRVGFSSDGLQALAYVGCSYAPLAGAGCYYVLSKEEGSWKIIETIISWIS